MQVKISARHGHLSEATQEFIRDKAEKLLHYFGRLTMIQVTVDLKNEQQKTVEFKPDGEHKLTGKADFQVDGKFRATVTLKIGSREVGKGRYNMDVGR